MPSAITLDYQVSIAPLANEALEFFMGTGTPYQIDKFLGLDVDDVRTDDAERLLDHGSFPGLDLLGSRGLTLGIVTFGTPGDPSSGLRTPAQVVSNQDALVGAWTAKSLDQAALDPTTPSMVLRYKLPGQAVRRFVGRCRKVARNDDTVPVGFASATLEFVALDPRQYADDLSTLTLKAGTATNLFTDPSHDNINGTTVARQNAVINPAAVSTGTAIYASIAGTGGAAAGTYVTGQAGFTLVTTAYRTTWSVGTSAVTGGATVGRSTANDIAVTAGDTISTFLQGKSSKVQRLQPSLTFYDAANAQVGASVVGTTVVVAAAARINFAVPVTVVPATAVRAVISLQAVAGTSGANWAAADTLDVSMAHVEANYIGLDNAGTIPDIARNGTFTGAHPAGTYGADYTYAWAGAANASVSEMRAPALTNWTGAGVTPTIVSASTERALFGARSAKVWWSPIAAQGDGQTVTGLTIGQTYVYSRYVYVPSGNVDVRLSVDSMVVDGLGGNSATIYSQGIVDSWVRLTGQIVATATTHNFRIVPHTTPGNRGQFAYADGALLTLGADLEPFQGTSSSGLVFPVTFPLNFTPVNGSDLQVINAGTFSSRPQITVTGPVTNPRITNVEDGTFIQVNMTLGATDYLVINTDTRQVLLGGTSSRAYLLALGSKFPRVRPGINTFRLGGTWATGDRPRLSVAFRSAWL